MPVISKRSELMRSDHPQQVKAARCERSMEVRFSTTQ
jgi:hypothetical protein